MTNVKRNVKYLRALLNEDMLNAVPMAGLANFLNKKRTEKLRHPDRLFKTRLIGHTLYANIWKAPVASTIYDFTRNNISELYTTAKNVVDQL